MAHVAKYKRGAVAPMVGHYNRTAERDGFARANIDPERTPDNYAVGFESRDPDALAVAVRERVARAVGEHKEHAGRAVRDDAVLMCDWVVTLPADCPRDDAPAFFAAVVAFAKERYGAENVLGGFVHMDEAAPHAHVPVVPTVDGKLQASKLVNRSDLQTFHRDLGRAVDAALGYHVSVELGDDQKGAKQLSRLGQEEYQAAKDELARVEAERAALAREVSGLRDKRDEIARDTAEASERLERLQRRADEAGREVGTLRNAVEEREGAVSAAELVAQGCGGRELGRRAEEARGRVAELGDRVAGMRERLALAREALASMKERVAALAPAERSQRWFRMPFDVSMRLGRWLDGHGYSAHVDVDAQARLYPERMRKPALRERVSARTPQEERDWVRTAPRRPSRPSRHRGR